MTHFKISRLLVAASMALGFASVYAGGAHDHTPKFGGIVVEAKDMDYEIVAKPDLLQIYVSDHGKPLKMDGGKAKVTLLNGTEKSEVELQPAGNKLEAKGSFKAAKGTKGIAVVTVNGKTNTVRFELK